jgi:hypothetical protein
MNKKKGKAIPVQLWTDSHISRLSALRTGRLYPHSQEIFLVIIYVRRVKWVPVTMAWRVLRLLMEERPPIWRVAANKLNKQSRTADEGVLQLGGWASY